MENSAGSETNIALWLVKLRQGEPAAREALLNYACERLRLLTRRLLAGFPQVHRWEQTDDVLQNALLRLYRALEVVQPDSVRGFMGLAATQIRRELIDLARSIGGPEGLGANIATNAGNTEQTPAYEIAANATSQTSLHRWTELHRQVEHLPPEEREVFDLLFYQGLQQSVAAEILNVHERTVKRRWRAAKLSLHAALGKKLPT